MSTLQRITPFLWFDDKAEHAVEFYTSVFDNSGVVSTTRYSKESAEVSGRKEGTIMTIEFELDGQRFTAINGGPGYPFNEAISLTVNCETQAEVDHYWERLNEGGDPKKQQCGWLKDKFGISWQVVPTELPKLIADPDVARSRRVVKAMLAMKKLDLDALRNAAAQG